jgi:predicted phosphodiesterase
VYSFNLLIAKNRLDYYFDKMIEKYMERPDRYDLIVLNLGGDHIEGDGSIYASQAFELETGINQQMIAFQEILMKNVKRLSMLIEQNNGHIMIKAVPGNHGENRKDFMTNPTSNFDYIMYMQIEYMLKIQKESGLMTNVSIEMPNPIMVDRKFVKYNIKGWNFHLEHIFQNNFITPSGQAKIRNLDEIADGVDVILTGHLHQEVMATIGKTTIIRSPALTGYDDYAHTLKAPMSESMHPILVTTPQQKIKEYLPISLGKII